MLAAETHYTQFTNEKFYIAVPKKPKYSLVHQHPIERNQYSLHRYKKDHLNSIVQQYVFEGTYRAKCISHDSTCDKFSAYVRYIRHQEQNSEVI